MCTSICLTFTIVTRTNRAMEDHVRAANTRRAESDVAEAGVKFVAIAEAVAGLGGAR